MSLPAFTSGLAADVPDKLMRRAWHSGLTFTAAECEVLLTLVRLAAYHMPEGKEDGPDDRGPEEWKTHAE